MFQRFSFIALHYLIASNFVAKISVCYKSSFTLNSFLSLIVDKGVFKHLANHIFGIVPMNSKNKTYSLTFTHEKYHKLILLDPRN